MFNLSLKLRFFIFAVLIGQAFALLTQTELFPFSPYGMYSENFDGRFKKMEVTGIPTKKAFWPFFEAGLSESLLLHFEKNPGGMTRIGRDLMNLYQQRRSFNELPELPELTINLVEYQVIPDNPPKLVKRSEAPVARVRHEN